MAVAPTLGPWSFLDGYVDDAPFSLTPPLSTSPGVFTYSSDNLGVASVSGDTLAITGIGIATITATQAAAPGFTASSRSASLSVDYRIPSIAVWALATKFAGDPAYSLPTPSSSSPSAFTYTSSNLSVATISGGTVTIVAAGSSTITASQPAVGAFRAANISASLAVSSPAGWVNYGGKTYVKPDGVLRTRAAAALYCSSTTFGGQSGWSLPPSGNISGMVAAIRPLASQGWPMTAGYLWTSTLDPLTNNYYAVVAETGGGGPAPSSSLYMVTCSKPT